jgi:hypothetical protein
MFRGTILRVGVALMTLALLPVALASQPAATLTLDHRAMVSERTPGQAEEHDVPNPDPVGSDAAEISEDQNISVDEARAAIEIQPEIGRMEADLEKALPVSYGGALIEYQPEYGVTILVEPGHTERVASAIERRGFGHLRSYITLRETRFTRPAVLRAVARVREISEGRVTSTDIDLNNGVVEVTAATDEDVAWIREAVERNRSSIEAVDVVVVQSPGGGEESESYGGLQIVRIN